MVRYEDTTFIEHKRYTRDMKTKNYQSIDGIKPRRNEAEFQPVKESTYRLFLIWRSLPPNMKGIDASTLLEMGVKSNELIELIECKTMLDFAAKFRVHKDTMTRWRKQEPPEHLAYIDWRYWAKQFTPEVVYLLLEGIREKKKADAIKLWFQTVDGYVEETSVNTKSTEALDAVAQLIDEVNGKAEASEQHYSDDKSGNQPTE